MTRKTFSLWLAVLSLILITVLSVTPCSAAKRFSLWLALFGPDEEPKPTMVTMAAYDIGSRVFSEVSTVADSVYREYGVKMRTVPLDNSLARAITLHAGTTQLWQSSTDYYLCSEGLGEFASLQWGPQPLSVVYMAHRRTNFSPATNPSSGITSMADIRGKRVAWIDDNPAINIQTEAYLAYANLTRVDVQLVRFPSYATSVSGLLQGEVDVALAAPPSPESFENERFSTEGLVWIPVPHGDSAGWKRIQSMAAFVGPVVVSGNPNVNNGRPLEAGTYANPVVVAYDSMDENTIYWVTKMIAESWKEYQTQIKAGRTWYIDEMLKGPQAIPFHKGAIRYFKEVGRWNDELEARQEFLLKRRNVLRQAFAKVQEEFVSSGRASKDFAQFWYTRRGAALTSAGMPLR